MHAATSGSRKFFLGTDSAPHAKGAKVRVGASRGLGLGRTGRDGSRQDKDRTGHRAVGWGGTRQAAAASEGGRAAHHHH